MICPVGTLPGWLDELGEPTSCVDNHAVLPVKVEPGVAVTVEPMTVLPHTAAPEGVFVGAALLVVAVGMLLRRLSVKK
jgi:hypothetical protein